MMHGHEKSELRHSSCEAGEQSGGALLRKQSAVESAAAEPVERRAEAKGNAGQQSTGRTPSRDPVSQAPERIRQACRKDPRWEPYAGKPNLRF